MKIILAPDSFKGNLTSLEVAVALKQSAQADHQRIFLPIEDRSLGVVPHPYRLKGGDVAGWQSIGYTGPPQID